MALQRAKVHGLLWVRGVHGGDHQVQLPGRVAFPVLFL
jgi:hypothetical protein